MGEFEPCRGEVILNTICAPLLKGPYKDYINSLGLKGNENILDFGSGIGIEASILAKRLSKSGGQLTCIDVSETWLNVVRKKLKKLNNVHFIHGRVYEQDIVENIYDVVYIHFVLHDVEKEFQLKTISALSKILKSGGRLYIREPLNPNHGMSSENIRTLMSKAGLTEVKGEVYKKTFLGIVFAGVYQK